MPESARPAPPLPLLPAVLLGLVLVYPVFTGNTGIFDQAAHRDFARALRDDGQLLTPHFVYHLLLLGVDAVIPGGGLRIAGITVNIAAYVTAATLFFAWGAAQLAEATSTRRAFWWGLTLLSLLILGGPPLAAISYHTDFRLNGYIILNQFHSPTQSVLIPLALLLYALTLRLLFTGHASRGGVAALFALSIITPLTKPNFSMVLLPAVLLLMAWRLLRREPLPLRALLLSVVIPGMVALSWQFVFTYIQQRTLGYGINPNNGIIFAPLKPALYFDTSVGMVALKLVSSLAFPLWALTAYPTLRRDPVTRFTWLMLFIGLMQYLLLSESGDFYMAANFNWGLRLSALFVYGLSLVGGLRAELAGGHITPRTGVSALLIAGHLVGGLHLYVGYANAIVPTLP